ncbi:hypothetical protein CFC21_006328 [Triticum aestivum]|uniref:Uncharacterized protein n=3 Tax=Triticum TaxID=4564 RepID=A0A9R0QT77_TRITD|nr:uncharacterized protein LOC119332542 isoform X1 [Triticum dicoccoides]XP_044395841.1 uncharacterized protein LOC123119926 [Triticum aestivum]KAF6988903.1 hypothetical protein CFC21_006328 [Triticum aestivum]VAH16089.1 unnamed protein product [Triticum turgidum subsp. durum]
MAGLQGFASDEGADRHGLSDIGGSFSVGGVSLLAHGTGLFADFSMLQKLRTEQGFQEYLKFREHAFKLAAEELVAACNSPVDLFVQTECDERLFQEHFLKFVTLREQYSVVVDDVDGSKESLVDDGSPRRVLNEDEFNHIQRKNDKDILLNTLHGVRRYYAYRKALLQLDFIKWNSNPEEVLERIKESTRWFDELDDYELQLGLKGHMELLKRYVSELDTTSTSSSMPEFESVALEEINSRMSSELEKHLHLRDQWLMQEYFNRVKIRNFARVCYNESEKTGVILVEEFLPVRQLQEQMLPKSLPQILGEQLLPRNLPQMKQRVKQSLESAMGYLHRQRAPRPRVFNLACAITLLSTTCMANESKTVN